MNDLFISYAHIDDRPMAEGKRGWISQFHHALELRLSQLMGREVRVWRDPKLQGNDFFDQTIVEQFQGAKAMVSVITPRYVRSEWCQREFAEFSDALEKTGGLRVRDKSRVFKVVKTPVELEDLPPQIARHFQSLLGFEFFEIDPDTGRVREYDEVFGTDAKQRYYERIYDLAHEVNQLFRLLGRAAEGGVDAGSRPETGRIVYLATTTSDLREEHDQLRRELVEAGHTVLPDAPLPTVAEEFERAVRGFLERSNATVHLIGERFGLVPEGARESTTQLQNRWAAELSEEMPGLQRFIWMPGDLHPEDERQAAFVAEVEENPKVHRGAELVEGTLSLFKKRLVDKLAPKETRASGGEGAPSGDSSLPKAEAPAQVYLICDPRDEAAAGELEDFLFDQGLEVRTPDFDADEVEFTDLHHRFLSECDGVVIYYGQVRKSWVEIKVNDLLKAGGLGRRRPFVATAVYVAPPDDPRKRRFRTHGAEIVRQTGERFEATPELEAFANRLKEGRTA